MRSPRQDSAALSARHHASAGEAIEQWQARAGQVAAGERAIAGIQWHHSEAFIAFRADQLPDGAYGLRAGANRPTVHHFVQLMDAIALQSHQLAFHFAEEVRARHDFLAGVAAFLHAEGAQALQRKLLRGPGFGLVGMQERMLMLGGQLQIDSQPGEGTTLCARINLEKEIAA